MKRFYPAVALVLCALAAMGAVSQVMRVSAEIRRQSNVDEARPADVILVLGAAEYRGRPSPVLEARLNHALFLYHQNMAPRILTTGGKGGDPTFTEGEVAHSYLSHHEVPFRGDSGGIRSVESTVHSIAAAAEIMRRMNLKSCIVVSDGYHIYRVKKMLETLGMQAYGSPRPERTLEDQDSWRQRWVYARQAIAYAKAVACRDAYLNLFERIAHRHDRKTFDEAVALFAIDFLVQKFCRECFYTVSERRRSRAVLDGLCNIGIVARERRETGSPTASSISCKP